MPKHGTPMRAQDLPAAVIASFQEDQQRRSEQAQAQAAPQRRLPPRKRPRASDAAASSSEAATFSSAPTLAPAAPTPTPAPAPAPVSAAHASLHTPTNLQPVRSVLNRNMPRGLRVGWWHEMQQEFAHKIAAGKVLFSPGQKEFPEPLTESSTWVRGVLPNLGTFPADHSGGWNIVWKLDKDNLRELDIPIDTPAVIRVTKPGKYQSYSNLLKEFCFSVHAAKVGFGVHVYCAILFLSDQQDLSHNTSDWRMMLVMDQCESDLVHLMAKRENPRPYVFVQAQNLYETCADLSTEGIFALDLKPANVLQKNNGLEIFVIDMDPTYTFFADTLSTEAAMFVNVLLLCLHLRVSFNKPISPVTQTLELLQEPVFELWRRAKADAFRGGSLLAHMKMPMQDENSHFYQALNRLRERERTTLPSDMDRLELLLPAIVYSYFISTDRTDPPPQLAGWRWQFPRTPFDQVWLIPQLLRFTFFGDAPVPHDKNQLLETRKKDGWPR